MNIEKIINSFPRTSPAAHSGWIPIELFDEFEAVFRAYMRPRHLRAIYRGPRKSNDVSGYTVPSMTRRCDATHVVFYYD